MSSRRFQNSADAQFTDNWDRLAQAIREIHKKNASILSFEELYRNAYNMVLHKNGDKLYNGVREVITQHLEEVAVAQVVPAFPLSGASSSQTNPNGAGGANFLKVLKCVWEDHTTCMLMIRDILMYMDRVYAKTANVPLVYDLGLDLFRDTIVRSQNYPIQNHLLDVLLQQIKLERENEIIDRSNVKASIDMLLELTDASTKDTVYATDFEHRFLDTSSEYYRVEGQMLVGECDAPEYMKKVDKRLNEEEQRVRHYLSQTTEPKIRSIVEEELISKHLKTVIEMENSGLIPMLRNEKMDDLGRMYKLFGRVGKGHDEMKSAISDYIRELGKAINETVTSNSAAEGSNVASGDKQTGASVAIRWVQEVLDLKDKFDKVQNLALSNDKAFQTSFNEAFEHFINKNPKSPEFISLFIDDNLKKGLKGKTEEEVDNVLDKTITLFRFIGEKDVFERYYKQHLAKRLLLGRSVSDDAERGMIGKLKVECGYQFTTKLEGMFNDMRISSDTMSDFKDYLDNKSVLEKPKLELSVTVLTSTFWPMNLSASPRCNLPAELTKACDSFQRFYLDRHSGRRLTWQSNMGSADIRGTFKARKHELNVSTYQMVILLMFNDLQDGESLTYEQIKGESDIPEADLKRNLQSLACAKYKILVKEPKGKEINPGDIFFFNYEFTAPLQRIKIPTVASKVETEGERKETREKVEEARKHQTEAAIVRIMKDRKTMDHNNLVAEVVKQLQSRFVPNPALIKKRIEALIEREYLERASGDR
ncbi:Cullin-domain-containing protein [Glomus cerebriforme]|uniref:Cullin-domain-containing protein n=1 Tax=Glomus cerebriforme TaxID=658196 RepID=A0A397TA19_9GLOM|nr:Cullin-domain-containing protein [Glomus cerebriforme]